MAGWFLSLCQKQTVNTMIKTILITAAGVIVGLIAYELGKNLLGLNSYEEDYEQLTR